MEPASQPHAPSVTPRRNFLSAAAAVLTGALVGLAPMAASFAFLVDPLLRKRSNFKGGDDQGFLPVTSLADLPADGTPLRFVLRADKLDAWNLFSNQTIGTVYLRKMPGDQIIAFSDTCPHLGCKVDYQEGKKEFLCPCHASAFELDGKPMNKIPPRGLDTLASRVDSDGQVWVKYQEFQCGVSKQEPV